MGSSKSSVAEGWDGWRNLEEGEGWGNTERANGAKK